MFASTWLFQAIGLRGLCRLLLRAAEQHQPGSEDVGRAGTAHIHSTGADIPVETSDRRGKATRHQREAHSDEVMST